MLPWSVIPMAGCPSAAALAITCPTLAAPSSIENSVCKCRWVNDAATAVFAPRSARAEASTALPGGQDRLVHRPLGSILWTSYRVVICSPDVSPKVGPPAPLRRIGDGKTD